MFHSAYVAYRRCSLSGKLSHYVLVFGPIIRILFHRKTKEMDHLSEDTQTTMLLLLPGAVCSVGLGAGGGGGHS